MSDRGPGGYDDDRPPAGGRQRFGSEPDADRDVRSHDEHQRSDRGTFRDEEKRREQYRDGYRDGYRDRHRDDVEDEGTDRDGADRQRAGGQGLGGRGDDHGGGGRSGGGHGGGSGSGRSGDRGGNERHGGDDRGGDRDDRGDHGRRDAKHDGRPERGARGTGQGEDGDRRQDPHEDRHREDPRAKERLTRTVKRVLLVLVIVAVLTAIIGITVRLVHRAHVRKSTENDAQTTVVTVKPTPSAADNELVLPGNVTAYMEAPIYARTSGYLKTWYTDIGAHVRKGQLLAEIETPEVDRQLAQARADLDTARANAHLAQTTNARWQGLAAKQAVSKQDADERAGNAAASAASEASAEQNVKRLEDLESFKRVLAPFDGVVTARNTDVGALINAGETSGAELFRIADIHTLRVYAQVPEPYASATRPGLRAELHFTEHPGQGYPAETVRTSNALDPTARTLQVELQLDNKEGLFFPGAYAEVHFKLPSERKTLRLPSNTILFRDQGLQVATVDAQHKVVIKPVVQGRDFGKTVEILDGLDAKDEVIVNPSDSIDNGMQVRIQPPRNDGQGGQDGQANQGAAGAGGAPQGEEQAGRSTQGDPQQMANGQPQPGGPSGGGASNGQGQGGQGAQGQGKNDGQGGQQKGGQANQQVNDAKTKESSL